MGAPPPYFEKSLVLYNYLDERADDNNNVAFVQVDVMAELDYPLQYASRLRLVLESLECITQIQRGARNRPTVWQLHKTPTLDEYNKQAEAGAYTNFSQHQTDYKFYTGMMDQRFNDLNERVMRLEKIVDVLLKELQTREPQTLTER
jgi:hypothetical protein